VCYCFFMFLECHVCLLHSIFTITQLYTPFKLFELEWVRVLLSLISNNITRFLIVLLLLMLLRIVFALLLRASKKCVLVKFYTKSLDSIILFDL
jgi:signal transduction histidine kinase